MKVVIRIEEPAAEAAWHKINSIMSFFYYSKRPAWQSHDCQAGLSYRIINVKFQYQLPE